MKGPQPVRGVVFAVLHEPARTTTPDAMSGPTSGPMSGAAPGMLSGTTADPAVGTAPGTASRFEVVLELHGPTHTVAAESLAARLAERHREYSVTLDTAADGRHLLRLTRTTATHGPARHTPVEVGPELLSDVLALPTDTGEPVPVTGYRRELLLGSVRPDGDEGVEQLHWNWTGPLDTARFTASWRSVMERESVLRASFDWAAVPRIVLHPRGEVDVERHHHTSVTWSDLLERDRSRGFDTSLPGLLRLTLLDGRGTPEGVPRTRVLLTYHRALLDERGAHLLLAAFYRAYVLGGVLPGGERRPDLRDHARWLAGRPTEAAREFWSRSAPPADAAISPGLPGAPTRHTGFGRIRRRLPTAQAHGLRTWAAARGAGESSALHVAWALLLYRAAGAEGPLPVSFGIRLTGRDLDLAGAAGVPGLLGTTVPMTVTVAPGTPLAELVRTVRDAMFDLTGYPWVQGDWIREWSGRDDDGERLTDTAVLFDNRPELPEAARAELRLQGIEVDTPRGIGGATTLPVTLIAEHDADGGLILTGLYDRTSLTDGDAAELLSQCVRLLRGLPGRWELTATVRDALELLAEHAVPHAVQEPPRPSGPVLTTLRPGAPGAGVVCLVSVPGVPSACYDHVVDGYDGPERIVGLRLDGPPQALPTVLTGQIRAGGRLVLCGYGAGAWPAYELACAAARLVPTVVVMAGDVGAAAGAEALARGLESALAREA